LTFLSGFDVKGPELVGYVASLFGVIKGMLRPRLDLEIVQSVVIADLVDMVDFMLGICQQTGVPRHLAVLKNVAVDSG
jgi:hypothetical protein